MKVDRLARPGSLKCTRSVINTQVAVVVVGFGLMELVKIVD